ncbi:hypothetical protein L228DRAFT_250473 [Xylona heveae TC161]|uniref:Uncharacterized protein n=1 Tax=Xylona heveae (strain CBS 132557 / TC161) TaxID=1328760 RepID=A0A165A720_XYLHT|nr:hypothetical protein L228DRAFT_250473 [Xylona heveae TC161]KZF20045.1 hypothetical protein L228DRAFT_250473 [Xylona heveae TC161]
MYALLKRFDDRMDPRTKHGNRELARPRIAKTTSRRGEMQGRAVRRERSRGAEAHLYQRKVTPGKYCVA